MMTSIDKRREELQKELDGTKSKEERNRLGQYSTPYGLAKEIMQSVKGLFCCSDMKFLEPAVGLGVFYSALIDVFGSKPSLATGYEIDSRYGKPAQEIWKEQGFEINIADFLKVVPRQKYNLLVANPPYSRHHHIPTEEKLWLKQAVKEETGIDISGLAGLYCYFLMLSSKWLEENAISVWLIPSEFMDVNYGKAVKQYLLNNVELIRIHRFLPEDMQFADALVTSSVVIFRKRKCAEQHHVTFTEGGSMMNPLHTEVFNVQDIRVEGKWTRMFSGRNCGTDNGTKLGDFFTVSRGLATGANEFFIVNDEAISKYQIPGMFLKPILPAPRFMKESIITRNGNGHTVTPLFLFSCNLPEKDLRTHYPCLWKYIQQGIEEGIPQRYICQRRTPWYSCESREPAPVLIPYMGRNKSGNGGFRFILNETDMIATNSYLMLYPKKSCMKDKNILYQTWHILNSMSKTDFLSGGRVYGGGLYKIEPRELMNIPMPEMSALLGIKKEPEQLSLF